MEDVNVQWVPVVSLEDRVEEFSLSSDCIESVGDNIVNLKKYFLEHMDRTYLSYDFEIGGKSYSIRPPFTLEEQIDQKIMKVEIFNKLIKEAFNDFIDKIDEYPDNFDYSSFRFILHPMRVGKHSRLMDQFAQVEKDLHQETQISLKNYEDILSVNPKYFKEEAYKFVHMGPESIDDELLDLPSFRNVLHNYMVSDECTAERDRIFNMKTVNYFPELIEEYGIDKKDSVQD